MKNGDKVKLVKAKYAHTQCLMTHDKEYVVSNVEKSPIGGFWFEFKNDAGMVCSGKYPSCAFGEWEIVK